MMQMIGKAKNAPTATMTRVTVTSKPKYSAKPAHTPKIMPRRDDAGNADLLERLNKVEERVRVLERIVTDERYDLKQQFKDLDS